MKRVVALAVIVLVLAGHMSRAQYPAENRGPGTLREALFGEPTLAPPRATSSSGPSGGPRHIASQKAIGPTAKRSTPARNSQEFDPFGHTSDEQAVGQPTAAQRSTSAPRAPQNSAPLPAQGPATTKTTRPPTTYTTPAKAATVKAAAPANGFIDAEEVPVTREEPPVRTVRTTKRSPEPPKVEFDEASTEPAEVDVPAAPIVTTKTIAAMAPRQVSGRLTLSRRSPQLTVEASGPRRATVGRETTYTVIVRNQGDEPAENVIVSVGIPQWVEMVDGHSTAGSASPSTEPGQEGLQWRIDQITGQSKHELTLKLIARKSQSFDFQLRSTCSPAAVQGIVEVEEPKLQLAITGPSEVNYGEQQSYKLTLSNPGNGTAENVTICLLPLDARDGQPVSQSLGTLSAGGSKSVEIELVARQSGELTIAAEATADGELKTATQHAVRVRRGDLKVAVSGPKHTLAGVPAQYEIRVQNPGDAPSRRVRVNAQLPSGTEVVSVSQQGQHIPQRNEIGWSIESLPAGGEQVLLVKCILRNGGAQRLAVNASAEGDLHQLAEASTNVTAVADLALEVTDSPGPIALGQTVTYDVKIRNRGTGSADGLEVVAYFSEGIEPVNVDGAPHQLGPGTATIKPGKALTAGGEILIRVRAKASTAGQHKIRVELACQSLGTKLTQEDSTLFYSEDGAAETAPLSSKPASSSAPTADAVAPTPTTANSPTAARPGPLLISR